MTQPYVTDCTPSIIPPPATPAETPVGNDGFFPDIAPADVRARARIDTVVTAPRLREAIRWAIVTVNNQLAAWADAQRAAGHAAMGDVPASMIDGESRLSLLYFRAVASAAKAEVVERYRDFDLTAAGQRKVDELDASVGELRRDSVHAVRDILGVTRTVVDLI